MKVNTLFLPYSQNSCFVFPGTTLSVRNSNVIWRRKEATICHACEPSATSCASCYAGMIGTEDKREWIDTSTTNFMLSISSNNRQFDRLLNIRSTLQPVHVFSYKAFCPLRLFASLPLVRLFSSIANVKAVSGHFGHICLYSIFLVPL